MGYNTTVLINNDALGDIAADPDFGKRLSEAINLHHMNPTKRIDVPAYTNGGRSVYTNAAIVIAQQHSSECTGVLVTGNTAYRLGTIYNNQPTTTKIDNQIALLNEMLSTLGYEIKKKDDHAPQR